MNYIWLDKCILMVNVEWGTNEQFLESQGYDEFISHVMILCLFAIGGNYGMNLNTSEGGHHASFGDGYRGHMVQML